MSRLSNHELMGDTNAGRMSRLSKLGYGPANAGRVCPAYRGGWFWPVACKHGASVPLDHGWGAVKGAGPGIKTRVFGPKGAAR